ncbi:MAG: DUF3786 domain-containing protein [Chloroflexi bacterium]|nr:DUF3786 domain-containing protein [Chloroflexota bacterium]
MQNEMAYQAAFTQSRNKLARLTPEEIEHRSLCRYDARINLVEIKSLGEIFRVSYPTGIVEWDTPAKKVPLDWALVLLNYLSSAQDKPLAGQWVTYRELPSGQVFYGNLERYTLKELSEFYARCDKHNLWVALEKLGGAPSESHADLSFQVDFAPRVPVLLQFWDGDEDMLASSQILFDQNVVEQLHIEDVAVVCGIVARRMMKQYADEIEQNK